MKVITIGRDQSNDKVILDPYTTRHHMQIIQHDDGHFSLSDFGSTNGTYVNGQKISGEIPLNDTDVVRIGNTTIPWRMYFEDSINPEEPSKDTYNMHSQETMGSLGKIDQCKERKEIGMSGVTVSLVLLVTMSLPIIVIMVIGGWVFIARLIIALMFGFLAFIFAKRADKKANENDVKKAVKAAKNARSSNIVQIIYGVFSWIALIRILIGI